MITAKERLLTSSSRQLNETENSHNCHTGRGEAVIRYPEWISFFLDSGHPPAADSGMTGSFHRLGVRLFNSLPSTHHYHWNN